MSADIRTARADPLAPRTIKVCVSQELRVALHTHRILHGESISNLVEVAVTAFLAERAAGAFTQKPSD